MIIELYGPPGSGKSTFARALLDFEFARPRPVFFVWRVGYILLFIAKHFTFFKKSFFSLCFQKQPIRLLWWKIRVYLNRVALWQEAHRVPGKVFIDEGMLQQLLTLFESVPDSEVLKELIILAPKPDGYVLFDLPQQELLLRMKNRGRGMRSFMGASYEARWRDVVFSIHENIILESKTFSTPVWYIRNTKDEHSILESLCEE